MFWAFQKFVPGVQELFSGFRTPSPQSPHLPPSPAPISAPNIDRGLPPPIPARPAHLQQQFNTPVVQLDIVHLAHGPPPPLPPPPPPSMLNAQYLHRAHGTPPPLPPPPPPSMLNAQYYTSKLPECPRLASQWVEMKGCAFNASSRWNNYPKQYSNVQCAIRHSSTGATHNHHATGRPTSTYSLGPPCTSFHTEREKLWFGISRKACRDALEEFGKLKPHQIGTIHLPRYMDPTYKEHSNATLEVVLLTALPDIGSILVNFDPQHPVISHFLTQTKGNADAMQVSQWIKSLGLVLYPELEEIVYSVVMRICNRFGLQDLPEPEQKRRIFSVGFALLQMLAAQHELEEPLDLSGSFLAELISRRVVFAGGQNDAASTMASNCKPEQLEKKFVVFKRKHTTYIDLHPSAFLRLIAAQPLPRPPASAPISSLRAGDNRPVVQGPATAQVKAVKPRPLEKKSTPRLEPGSLVDRVASGPETHTRTAVPSQAPKRKRVEFAELDPESEDSLEPLPRGKPRKAKVEMEVQRRKQPARQRGGRITK
ncbi:hypothetical protein GGX14DRAFT_383879 [Mycena pura]|uniref:Uncharacterized protein n=1 Tax=Mycena pura TaxID=153505 RepID=A0AAD6YV46_9AGAR|nr:hypothetical protein GGX14DRAFT_383879 [Mycena pura]